MLIYVIMYVSCHAFIFINMLSIKIIGKQMCSYSPSAFEPVFLNKSVPNNKVFLDKEYLDAKLPTLFHLFK